MGINKNFKKRLRALWKKSRVIRPLYWRVYKHTVFDWQMTKLYPRTYEAERSKPVDRRKVLFVEPTQTKLSNNFQLLYRELSEHYDFDIHVHYLRKTTVSSKEARRLSVEMIRDAATAGYIFVDEAMHELSFFDMRPETVYTQLWHACGAFKRFGMSTADYIFGDSRKEHERYPDNRNYTYVTVSSPEVIWAYEEALSLKDQPGVVRPVGVSRTDFFFDPAHAEEARERLCQLFPAARGRKVILYAPTFRGRVREATTPDCFDLQAFAEGLKKIDRDDSNTAAVGSNAATADSGASNTAENASAGADTNDAAGSVAASGDYVIILKHHPHVKELPKIPAALEGTFAYDATKTMSIEDLILVSDICISDYSSVIYEYSLMNRPMLFYAYDLEDYFDWRGFYYPYEDLTPGPVCRTCEEMIEWINHIDENFDPQQVASFRERFMSACDGHATERIMELVFGAETLDERRKK